MPEEREHPMPGQVLGYVTDFKEYGAFGDDVKLVADLDQANVTTSQVYGTKLHKLVVDVDLPVRLVESSTPGHHHLYVDHAMSWEDLERLLIVMSEVGLVQPGYLAAAQKRGYTALRLPWVKKDRLVFSEPPKPAPAEEDPF